MDGAEEVTAFVERFMTRAYLDPFKKLRDKAVDSIWWKFFFFISLPFFFLASFFYLACLPFFVVLYHLLIWIRLAVANADRVVFVLASSLLSFYQVPPYVFYFYIEFLAVIGLIRFLKSDSNYRGFLLCFLSNISCGTSNMFLRKFTTLHFRNPFNRCLTETKVLYFPIGLEIPSYNRIEVFDFPVSEHLDFDKTVGNCRIEIRTLGDTGTSTIRLLRVDAPWGWNRFTVNMENDNLGRLISYFNRVIETNCKELICSRPNLRFQPLSILGVVKHFNSGLQLVKLKGNYIMF